MIKSKGGKANIAVSSSFSSKKKKKVSDKRKASMKAKKKEKKKRQLQSVESLSHVAKNVTRRGIVRSFYNKAK